MKTRRTYIFFFSFLIFFASAQNQAHKDSVNTKWHYEPNFMVGLDVLNAGIGVFSDRQLFQGFVSSKITKNIHAVADAGYEKNIYNKNGYDARASGIFVKLGAFYMLVKDPENEFNGFYAGSKFAGSFYNQTYSAVPVRGSGGTDASVAYPSARASSAWLEGAAGGRVRLFKSNFYIDVNLQPRFLIYNKKQQGIYPMIVPGFGRSSSKFNMGFSWNMAYKF